MPVNWSDPQQVEAFRREVISKGADPQQAEAYIAQHAQIAPTEPQAPEEPKTLSGFAGNIVKSGARTIGDIGSAVINVLNPNMEKNTVANLGRLALGTGELLVPGEQGHEQYPKAVVNFYKSRYGSLKAAGDTLYNDPVGALLDASIVLDAGASLVGKVGEVGKVESLVKASKTAKGVAEAIDPLRLTTKAVGKVVPGEKVASKVEDLGKEAAVKALKPSPSQSVKFEALTGSALKDFIDTNGLYGKGNVAASKADDLIKPLQEQYNSLVRTGEKVDPTNLINSLYEKASEIRKSDFSLEAEKVAKSLDERAGLIKNKALKNGKIEPISIDIITETKSSAFSKAPQKALIDPATENANIIAGSMGIEFLDNYAPGSAEIGKKLQALREFKKIALKQGYIGQGSNILGVLKPSGTGALLGNMMGGPTGAVVGAGVGLASQNPTVLRGVSDIAKTGAKGIRNIPGINIGKAAKAGAISSRLTPVEQSNNTNDGQQNQGFNQGSPSGVQTDNINTSTDSISQDQQNIQSVTYPNPQTGEQTYNSFGATAPQIWEAYIKTLESGNKRKAAVLKEMYNHELDMKALENPKLNSSAAKAFSDNQTAINLANSLDGTISEFSDKMGPIAGRAASKNPYDTDAQAFQAEMEAAAQIIGKSMEGGVLRQEDVVKYRKILPQITDTPEVARRKIQAIKKLLRDQQRNQEKFYKNAQQDVVVQSPGGGGNPGLNLESRVNNFSTSRMQKPGLQLTPKYLYK